MTATREEIAEWLKECLEEVESEGALTALVLKHYKATGAEDEIHSMKTGARGWGDPSAMADVISTVATRTARGIASGSGVQQFQIEAVFGQSTKATRFLPFTRAGAPTQMVGPGFGGGMGGLASEPPNAAGLTVQAQRLTEIMIQSTMQERRELVQIQKAMIFDLHAAWSASQKQNMELLLGFQKVVVEAADKHMEMAVRVMTIKRNSAMLLELFKMSPAILNAVTGTEIFPVATADSVALRAFQRGMTPELMQNILSAHSNGTPDQQIAIATLIERLGQIGKEEAAQVQKIKDLQNQDLGVDPDLDAAGLPDPKAVLSKVVAAGQPSPPAKELSPKANGHSNGNGHSAPQNVVSEEAEMLDGILRSAGGRLEMLLNMMSAEDPDLAAKLRARAQKKGLL